MIIPWLIVWVIAGQPAVEWFGAVWNAWGITLLLAICLL